MPRHAGTPTRPERCARQTGATILLGNATSDKLTIFVGYYGMSYTQKLVLPVRDIINNCAMVQQTFSYINRLPRV